LDRFGADGQERRSMPFATGGRGKPNRRSIEPLVMNAAILKVMH
jgi:hypothetical protein